MSLSWNIAGILMDAMTPDVNGIVWSAAVTGWDVPATVESWDQKPNDEGAFEGPANHSYRDLTITIWAQGPDGDTIQRARMMLVGLLTLTDDVQINSIETVPWTVTGRRSGQMFITHQLPTQMSVNVLVRCKDPRKYGPQQSVALTTALPPPGIIFVPGAEFPLLLGAAPNSTTVTNTGPSKTPVIITFIGPLSPTFWIKNLRQNRRMAFNMTLNVGDQVTVDGTNNGLALLNGFSSVRGYRTLDSQMFMLDTGDTVLQFGSDAFSAGQAIISFAPASIG